MASNLEKNNNNAKLTCYNHFNKTVKHLDLRITKIWVKQK